MKLLLDKIITTTFFVTLFFMLSHVSANGAALPLTVQEQTWIDTHKSIQLYGSRIISGSFD